MLFVDVKFLRKFQPSTKIWQIYQNDRENLDMLENFGDLKKSCFPPEQVPRIWRWIRGTTIEVIFETGNLVAHIQ